jgi:probable F420-dependent oxidoreductase
MRESVEAVRMMLRHFGGDGPFEFRGEYTRHTLMTPNFNPGPNPFGPPAVLVGALGPRMTAMAAEVADGLLVMPFNSDRHFQKRTLPAIEAGLAAGGRSAADIEVIAEVIVATGRDATEVAAARQAVKPLIGFYGSTPSYRAVLDVEGRGDLQPLLNRLSKAGDWPGMAAAVDDDLAATIGVVGSPHEAAAEIVRRFGHHADRVCCYFPGYAIADEAITELTTAIRAH